VIEIRTERFRLRELQEADATERYLSWLRDGATARHIVAAADTADLAHLRSYVRERAGRSDVLFLGIFDGDTGLHIGNLKFEPIDSRLGYAIMGILIGDTAYHGRGVAGEVLAASARWLQANRGINEIVLGVSPDNVAAIRAYEKTGFVVAGSPHLVKPAGGAITMCWTLPQEPRAAHD